MFNVRDTNLEALKAKKSAVMKGYMEDKFINFFVPQPVKKEILMNRGYWIRSYCFRTIVQKFIEECNGPCQVLSIGCGLDTLPFNMLLDKQDKNFQFFECDLIEVVQHKIQLIQGNNNMENFMQQTSKNFKYDFSNGNVPQGILGDKYKLFACNLNNIENLQQQFQKYELQKNLPTLIISECVLIYLNEGKVSELMKMFSEYFSVFAVMDYEMFNGNDGFGKMMVKNFKSRGIPLYSIHDFDSVEQIKKIYTNLKYQCDIKTIQSLYWGGINQQELDRINKLEWIDEFEEFNLMCGHYFISIAKYGNLQQEKFLQDLNFSLLQLIFQQQVYVILIFLIIHRIYSPIFKK